MPINNSFVRFKEQGLAPVPGLSFVNFIFVDSEEWGLVPHSEFMDLAWMNLSNLRTDPLAVGSRLSFDKLQFLALAFMGN